MKIVSFESTLQKFPLTKPYTIAYKTIFDTDIVLFELRLSNGIVGFGASNPFPEVVGETPQNTMENLQSDALQFLIGKDINDFQQLINAVVRLFPDLPGTQAAIDIALHDAFGKYKNVSVLNIYGQKIKPLPTSITIGIKDVSEMIMEAKQYYEQGFRILKIKTGVNIDEDIERVTKISETFGNKMIIRVDANQGYDLFALQRFIKETKKIDIELIEQPLPVKMDVELNKLEESEKSILVADESLINIHSAIKLAKRTQPFGIFNIKLMKCGGIMGARQISEIALKSGISLFWGCNDENIVSITAAMHAAYSCKNTKYLDLDGSLDIEDPFFLGGFTIIDGYMYPNDLPGLGINHC
ncbi:MAG: dipeptide epimerase [Saprospiraceae bacterium]|jgi:L-alanine-DL-glutamate epimerase-like enolase superfamily enzyme|nr:dipeptide epimerase [Saprospiraceae bacterium]